MEWVKAEMLKTEMLKTEMLRGRERSAAAE
jgi:hypothetical protein